MERSVSVSVGVVFGLTLPALSSGMEDESPLRAGSKPGKQNKYINRWVAFIQDSQNRVTQQKVQKATKNVVKPLTETAIGKLNQGSYRL